MLSKHLRIASARLELLICFPLTCNVSRFSLRKFRFLLKRSQKYLQIKLIEVKETFTSRVTYVSSWWKLILIIRVGENWNWYCHLNIWLYTALICIVTKYLQSNLLFMHNWIVKWRLIFCMMITAIEKLSLMPTLYEASSRLEMNGFI